LIQKESINSRGGVNEWNQVDFKEYLNGEYYSGISNQLLKFQ